MKRIATAAFALCLMSGASALAEPNHDHNGGGPHAGPQGFSGHVAGPPRTFGHPQGGPGFSPQVHSFHGAVGAQAFVRPQGGPRFTPQVRSFHRNNGAQVFAHSQVGPGFTPQVHTGQNNGARTLARTRGAPSGFHPAFGAPGFHPGGPRPRYSPQFFPHTFNPGARFHWHGGNWSGPRGFYYRRWDYGQTLPFGWFGPQWFISDYWDYELPVPPYGYEWVRNGPDALLVNEYTGMIVEAVYGIFY